MQAEADRMAIAEAAAEESLVPEETTEQLFDEPTAATPPAAPEPPKEPKPKRKRIQ